MCVYNPFSLNNKTLLITGGSSGIGRSIAIECSKLGATVIISGRNKERLEDSLSLMTGNNNSAIIADLNLENDIIDLVQKLPQLDGIVHNAGIGDRIIAKAIKKTDIESIMTTNFEGPVLLQRHLLKQKKINKNSSVVFIASRAPFAPSVGNSIYSASKAAIIGYANVLGLELAPQNIRVNCICPAMVWTELVSHDASLTGGDYQSAESKYPLKRFGKPEDIAYLTIYLLSDASSWMTGSCINITGGGENTLS